MAALLLAPFASLNGALGVPLHATLYPFAGAPTLHAARVSLAYRGLSRRVAQAEGASSQRGALLDGAGFLVMAWGGSFLTNYLVGSVPIHLLSPLPFLNYISVHLLLGALLSLLPPPNAAVLDTLAAPIDGATRAHAVMLGVHLAATHSSPMVRNSLMAQVLLGTLAATGGSQAAGTLSVFSSRGWSFSTPPVLLATSFTDLLDVFAALLAAIVYGASTGTHPAYASLRAALNGGKADVLLTPVGGKAAAALVIAAVFAYRALLLHWLPTAPQVKQQATKTKAQLVEAASPATPAHSTRSTRAKKSA